MRNEQRLLFIVLNALVISSGISLILSGFVAVLATNDADQMRAVIIFGCFTVLLYGVIAPYLDFMTALRTGGLFP